MPNPNYSQPKLKILDVNRYRNIYFCGDVHGRFDLLEQGLKSRQFNSGEDLLVLVGDLIDRGRHCPQVIDFTLEGIKQGYVAIATGNHDHYPIGDYNYWMQNDGYWFEHIKASDQHQAKKILEKLHRLAAEPLALELITAKNRIGVVHGDVPENCWQTLRHLALDVIEPIDNTQIEETRWQRTLLSGRSILRAKQSNNLEQLRVANIDFVVSGHVVVQTPEFITNRAYIDTGAYFTNNLTLMSLDELLARFQALSEKSN